MSNNLSFLAGGGDVGRLIASYEWGGTALGPIDSWPEARRTAIAMVLRAPVPVALLLGPDGVMIYNDGYAGIALGRGRHPACLGASVLTAWPEVAAFNAEVLRVVLAGGTLSFRNHELGLMRDGAEEKVWFNLDYSPLPDARGEIVGVLVLVTEISERARFERAIVEDRARLRQMFEQAPSFMALLSGPEHVFELTNTAYRQLIGHRDVLGLRVREGLPELAGQGFFELLDRVYASGEPYVGRGVKVLLQTTPDSPAEPRTLDFVYQPVRDGGGEVTGIFVQGVDISDRIAAEHARAASEHQFRTFAQTMPNHVWVAGLDGGQTWVNDRMHDYAGMTPEELRGFGWRGTIHPDDLAETDVRWKESVATGAPYEREDRRRRHDGAWRWHLSRAVLIHDCEGLPCFWIGTSTDIDDQKLVEQALRDSELRLRLSQEAAGIASFEVDIAAGDVMGSERLWALWGLPQATRVPLVVFERLILPEDRLAPSSEAGRRDGTAAKNVEYRIRRGDTGEERWIARHVEYLRDAAGRPVKMFGVMRDVTDAKQSEIRQQTLTHELAHRIKNILATVSAIASQTLRDTDLATARAAFDTRLQALARGHDILNASRWTTASLGGVVEAGLGPFPGERITINGPDLAIGPRRALTLALAVNELGTNALKYGALGDNGGHVSVAWWREDTADGPRLVWRWAEAGGPAVSAPERRGFGRFLLERVLAADFGGSVRIAFAPGGVECILTAPWPPTQWED